MNPDNPDTAIQCSVGAYRSTAATPSAGAIRSSVRTSEAPTEIASSGSASSARSVFAGAAPARKARPRRGQRWSVPRR
ncbi:hypothetical protein BZL29_5324 [Mycobacterium kansasii]|uniref:Uncharacterized protein n=1 Tax=Mycobacterium kansasii TaxID=1768 RepID=A0A1V3X112_MYCKA|nr:hypothetical protein BZL29_5324 [Mycobacterium kansasii]